MRLLAALLSTVCATQATAHDWGGFYAGVISGYSIVKNTDQRRSSVIEGHVFGADNVISDWARWSTGHLGIAFALPPEGFMSGVLMGHNWVLSDRLVGSIEAGLSVGAYEAPKAVAWGAGNSFGIGTYSHEFISAYRSSPEFSLSARMGFLANKDTLIYGGIGASLGSGGMGVTFQIEEDVYAPPAQYTHISGQTIPHISIRPTATMGMESALSDHLRFRLEYAAQFAPSQKLATSLSFTGRGSVSGLVPDPIYIYTAPQFTHTVRAGISYAF